MPPSFEDNSNDGKVCKLKKSLYGLKQYPKAWFDRFTKSILKFRYCQSQEDDILFIKHSSHKKVITFIVYEDDIIVTCNDVEEMKNLKNILAKEIEIKDLRALRYFLGMEVARYNKGIFCFTK